MSRLVALLVALPSAALAHSWYPWECCSNRDCYPVAVENVRAGGGGWTLEDGTFVAYSEARASPDDRFHVCRREDGKGALIRIQKKPACFWAPMGSS